MIFSRQVYDDIMDFSIANKSTVSFILKKMVRAGQLGAKSGAGFFNYDKDGVRV